MSNIFFNYLLLITRGSPLSLLNNPNVKLIPDIQAIKNKSRPLQSGLCQNICRR